MKRWIWYCDQCETCGIVTRGEGESSINLLAKIAKSHDAGTCESRVINAKSLARLKSSESQRVINVLKKYSLVATSK
jgi:hypothetical protein